MEITSKRIYIFKIIVIILPLFLFLIWIFILPFIAVDAFDPSNQSFVRALVIPGLSAIIWAIFWQLRFYRSMNDYEKSSKRKKLSEKRFSAYDLYLNIYDVQHALLSKQFVVMKNNIFYRYERIRGGDIDTDEYTFVRFEETKESILDIFKYAITDEEPFLDAYKQRLMSKTYKYLVIIGVELLEYEKTLVEKICIEWKVQAMRLSALMPNEFWIPIIYIPQEQKLYILEYMSKKRMIENLFGIQFRKVLSRKSDNTS